MNKTIKAMAIMMVGCVAALSAKEWDNFAGLGINIPTETTVSAPDFNNGAEIVMDKQGGLHSFYMGVGEKGFAVSANLNTNYSDINQKVSGVDMLGADHSLILGLGFAPVHNEKFTLGLFGTCGLNITALYGRRTYSDELASNYKEEYTKGYMAALLGGNITAVYTPSNKFSIMAGCSVSYLTPGLYVEEYKNNSGVYGNSENSYETKSSLKVIPTVGVCWKF